MKEEWLLQKAIVPVDVETTAALVTEIKRLIDVVGGMALAQPEHQAEPPEWPLIKNILDEYGLDAIIFVAEWKAAQRTWVGLTDDEIRALASWWPSYDQMPALMVLAKDIQNSLKERNNG